MSVRCLQQPRVSPSRMKKNLSIHYLTHNKAVLAGPAFSSPSPKHTLPPPKELVQEGQQPSSSLQREPHPLSGPQPSCSPLISKLHLPKIELQSSAKPNISAPLGKGTSVCLVPRSGPSSVSVPGWLCLLHMATLLLQLIGITHPDTTSLNTTVTRLSLRN